MCNHREIFAVLYLAIHKVFGWVGAKMSQIAPKSSDLGANQSEYFMHLQVPLERSEDEHNGLGWLWRAEWIWMASGLQWAGNFIAISRSLDQTGLR